MFSCLIFKEIKFGGKFQVPIIRLHIFTSKERKDFWEEISGSLYSSLCLYVFFSVKKENKFPMPPQMLLAHWYDFLFFQKFIILTMKASFLAILFSFSLYVAYEKLWMSLLTISDSLFIKNVLGLFLQYKYLTQFSLNFSALVLERHCPWSLPTSH